MSNETKVGGPAVSLREQARRCADSVVRDVAELPDRSSPEDWPEAMLVTDAELRVIVADELIQFATLALKEAEQAVLELPSFHKFGDYGSYEMRSMSAAAIASLRKEMNEK